MLAQIRKLALGAGLAAALSASALAAGPEVNVTSTGLALRGYDPVTYQTAGAPQPGDFNITAEHEGAVYRFVNEENKKAFLADPAKYAPQYGGYCAFGTAMGRKFDGDPNVWKVVGGKLYLNLAPKIAELWTADMKGKIMAADEKWPAIKSVPPAELK
jgi:YHS domain-containing protein